MSWMHLRDTQPKARKRHHCLLCGQRIEPGTVHVARSGIQEREGPDTFRMHMICERMISLWLWDDGDWECHDAGSFREVINAMLPERKELLP